MKRKYTLEFDEKPALVFVQERFGKDFALYQDGEKVNGIRTVDISAAYDDATTHEIEYLTGKTESGPVKKQEDVSRKNTAKMVDLVIHCLEGLLEEENEVTPELVDMYGIITDFKKEEGV